MAYVDDSGAIETHDPPIRVFMNVYGPYDPVGQALERLLRKVRRGGRGTFCAALIPKPNEAKIHVEMLEGDRISVSITNVTDARDNRDYVIEPGNAGEDPDVRVV